MDDLVGFSMDITIHWEKQDGQGEVCDGCKDLIFGYVFMPVTQVGKTEELSLKAPPYKVCGNCMLEIERGNLEL